MITFSLSIICLTLLGACSFFGKESSVAAAWLGIGGGTPILTLDNDTDNNLSWQNSNSVIGSELSPIITGDCTNGITDVKVLVDSTLKLTAPCTSNRFSAALTGGNAFATNGTYQIEFVGVASGTNNVSVLRSYEINNIDPTTLISFDSFPTTSIYGSEDLSGVCHYSLTLTIAGNSTTCGVGATFREVLSLSMGSNSFLVTWTDDYHNAGTRTFAIIRNAAGGTDLTVGMKSAARHGSLALQNITSGSPSLAPTLERASATGTKNGSVAANIPLSITPSSGATGLKLSIGNHNFVFCENRSVTGECIP